MKPTANNVLVRIPEREETIESGMFVPDTAKETHSKDWGIIEGFGNFCLQPLKEGMKVLFDKGFGNEIEPGLFIVEEKRILAYEPRNES